MRVRLRGGRALLEIPTAHVLQGDFSPPPVTPILPTVEGNLPSSCRGGTSLTSTLARRWAVRVDVSSLPVPNVQALCTIPAVGAFEEVTQP